MNMPETPDRRDSGSLADMQVRVTQNNRKEVIGLQCTRTQPTRHAPSTDPMPQVSYISGKLEKCQTEKGRGVGRDAAPQHRE